jgi:hypothetical protein
MFIRLQRHIDMALFVYIWIYAHSFRHLITSVNLSLRIYEPIQVFLSARSGFCTHRFFCLHPSVQMAVPTQLQASRKIYLFTHLYPFAETNKRRSVPPSRKVALTSCHWLHLALFSIAILSLLCPNFVKKISK